MSAGGSGGLTIPIPDVVIEAAATAVAKRAVELLRDELASSSPWMTTEEAAEYLRIPLGTFKERAAAGEFDDIARKEGRRTYYHRAELDRHRGYDPAHGPADGAGPTPLRRRHAA